MSLRRSLVWLSVGSVSALAPGCGSGSEGTNAGGVSSGARAGSVSHGSGGAGTGGAGEGSGGRATGGAMSGGAAGQAAGAGGSAIAGAAQVAGESGRGTGGMPTTGGSGGRTNAGAGGTAGDAGGNAGSSAAGGRGGRGGAAGSAGMSSAGMAGSPMVGDCPNATSPIGWASVGGDGVTTTTGGEGGDTVKPTTADELIAYAASDEPLIIQIEGTFNVPRLNVASNKTLVGIGNAATLNGGVRIRGKDDDNVKNVILRNLHVNGGPSDADDDAMQIYFAHHVWIDHADIYDGPDGNLDITHASSWVTISWTKFRYTTAYVKPSGEDSDHRFSNLLGHSDNNSSEDTGRLKVTFHHDYWGERVIERMPRVRFGEVHVFNNYYNAPNNNYCIGGGLEAHLLVENNYFDDVKDPHRFQDDGDTAAIVARNNTYTGIADTTAKDTRGSAFTPGYTAALEPADATLKATVQKCAGPR
jgi:pectate lyase